MSTILQRVGISAVTDNVPTRFSPQSVERFPDGSAEMTVVALAKLRTLGAAGTETFVITGDSTGGGYWLAYAAGPGAFVFWNIGDGVGYPELAIGRELVDPFDVGHVHLIVATCSVDRDELIVYMNGLNDGTPDTATAYSPTPIGTPTVLNEPSGTLPLTSWDLIDLAMINDYALVQDEVTDLVAVTRAAGRVPSDFANWAMLLRGEDARAFPSAWNVGGARAGRTILRTGDTPLASPVLIGGKASPWGGL